MNKSTGIRRIINAFGYSMRGLGATFRHEAAFRQELLLAAVTIPLACWLPVTLPERLALIGCMFLILITELLNSAIEAVVDRVGAEHHVLSGRAKDMGSAAVFMALLFAVLCWGMILWPLLF